MMSGLRRIAVLSLWGLAVFVSPLAVLVAISAIAVATPEVEFDTRRLCSIDDRYLGAYVAPLCRFADHGRTCIDNERLSEAMELHIYTLLENSDVDFDETAFFDAFAGARSSGDLQVCGQDLSRRNLGRRLISLPEEE